MCSHATLNRDVSRETLRLINVVSIALAPTEHKHVKLFHVEHAVAIEPQHIVIKFNATNWRFGRMFHVKHTNAGAIIDSY